MRERRMRERRMRERWFLDSESPKRAPCAKLNWGSKSWRRQASGFLSRAPSRVGVKGAPRAVINYAPFSGHFTQIYNFSEIFC
jgi:hypothetical protein